MLELQRRRECGGLLMGLSALSLCTAILIGGRKGCIHAPLIWESDRRCCLCVCVKLYFRVSALFLKSLGWHIDLTRHFIALQEDLNSDIDNDSTTWEVMSGRNSQHELDGSRVSCSLLITNTMFLHKVVHSGPVVDICLRIRSHFDTLIILV